jgi:ABC-type transporter Mla MlaB component
LAAPQQPPETPASAPRPALERSTVALPISGPITDADVPELCRRVRTLLASSAAEVVVCDVRALANTDAQVVDALARLQLTARRLGCRIQLLHACGELQRLLGLAGLRDVLPVVDSLRLESGRQAEERKQA